MTTLRLLPWMPLKCSGDRTFNKYTLSYWKGLEPAAEPFICQKLTFLHSPIQNSLMIFSFSFLLLYIKWSKESKMSTRCMDTEDQLFTILLQWDDQSNDQHTLERTQRGFQELCSQFTLWCNARYSHWVGPVLQIVSLQSDLYMEHLLSNLLLFNLPPPLAVRPGWVCPLHQEKKEYSK